MAGTKGHSGGARPNTGGARPGAGRPPRPPAATVTTDPTEFLTAVMVGLIIPSVPQLHAATTLAKLKANPVDGKKARAVENAATIATGRFSARPAPLKLVGTDPGKG